MKKNQDIFNVNLDQEEQEISVFIDQSIDQNQLKSVDHVKEKMIASQKTANNYLRKDARITLRLSSIDLERLKQQAAYKGLPYQTFIASVLHEYAAGHFIEVA